MDVIPRKIFALKAAFLCFRSKPDGLEDRPLITSSYTCSMYSACGFSQGCDALPLPPSYLLWPSYKKQSWSLPLWPPGNGSIVPSPARLGLCADWGGGQSRGFRHIVPSHGAIGCHPMSCFRSLMTSIYLADCFVRVKEKAGDILPPRSPLNLVLGDTHGSSRGI